MNWRHGRYVLLCLLLVLSQTAAARSLPDAGLLGIKEHHLEANFWISRLADADTVRMDADAIADLNEALRQRDPSINRLEGFDSTVPASEIRKRIEAISTPLADERYDASGSIFDASAREALRASLALETLSESITPRFGLVVKRAALRTYPTKMKVFSRPDDIDIDRFQESALFVGDAVVVLHQSADARWLFVVAERYSAWIETPAVAIGKRDDVLRYRAASDALTVVGKTAQSVTAPHGTDSLSQISLDMGVRVPWLSSWPATRAISGQLPIAHWVVELPARKKDGSLTIGHALIARSEPMATAPLAYSSANLLRQAFRFLGERYGWGHDFNGRDCSGFVSEIYRSMGIVLPRNTGDQARSPVFDTLDLTSLTPPKRRAALAAASVGDLIHIPGHVMMIIGQIKGSPWVIHDAHGLSKISRNHALQTLAVNGVVVTPLLDLVSPDGTPLVQRVTHIQRIRPRAGI